MSFKQIAQYTGSGATTQFNTIQFSSIPSTYKHLWIVGSVQDGTSFGTNTATTMTWYYNTDTTTSNYSFHYNTSRWPGTYSNGALATTLPYSILPAQSSAADTVYGFFELLIPNYAGSASKSATWKNCSVNSAAADDENRVYINSGHWTGTSAINQITFYSDTTPDFASYTNIAVYGIEG